MQVKYARSDGVRLEVRAQSHSLTNGKIRQTKRYTAETIDWLAVYDATTGRCFYVPAAELGTGMSSLTLRLAPAANNQRRRTHSAADYIDLPA